jgi:hypothetical protein
MWLLKLKIKHDCTIGTRCEKFKVISYSLTLGNWKEKNFYYTSERHTLEGDQKNINRFLKDIKKDKRILNIEIDKNTLFFIARSKVRIPSSFYNQKMFFTNPVYVDKDGFEYWKLASYDRSILSKLIKRMEKQTYQSFEILKFKNVKLNNVYFPAIAPNLSEKQKRAFELAVENGYYDIPKKIDLRGLAKILKISIATFQEHLKRAEAKIIPKFNVK